MHCAIGKSEHIPCCQIADNHVIDREILLRVAIGLADIRNEDPSFAVHCAHSIFIVQAGWLVDTNANV